MKLKRPYRDMYRLASALVERLRPACVRIEIAGSIRRKKAEIGDIELIAIPRTIPDLLGEPQPVTEVDSLLATWPLVFTKNGPKYKQFLFSGTSGHEYQVDLFLPSVETWGINYMIRTGSAEFSKRMVTPQRIGGMMPNDLAVREGRVWRNGVALSTPEESDVFALWEMEFIQPEARHD